MVLLRHAHAQQYILQPTESSSVTRNICPLTHKMAEVHTPAQEVYTPDTGSTIPTTGSRHT